MNFNQQLFRVATKTEKIYPFKNIFIFSISVDRVENATLELQRVTRSQMGFYLCIASNGYPPAVSKKVHLNVNCKKFRNNFVLSTNYFFLFFISVRPIITVPEPRIHIRSGEDVSLECIFEFFPRGLIWWEKGNSGT